MSKDRFIVEVYKNGEFLALLKGKLEEVFSRLPDQRGSKDLVSELKKIQSLKRKTIILKKRYLGDSKIALVFYYPFDNLINEVNELIDRVNWLKASKTGRRITHLKLPDIEKIGSAYYLKRKKSKNKVYYYFRLRSSEAETVRNLFTLSDSEQNKELLHTLITLWNLLKDYICRPEFSVFVKDLGLQSER